MSVLRVEKPPPPCGDAGGGGGSPACVTFVTLLLIMCCTHVHLNNQKQQSPATTQWVLRSCRACVRVLIRRYFFYPSRRLWGGVKCCSSTCYIFSCFYTSSFWPLIAAKLRKVFETAIRRLKKFFLHIDIKGVPTLLCSLYHPHNHALKP